MNKSHVQSSLVVHPYITEVMKYGRYPAMVESLSMKTDNFDLASALFQKQTIVLHEETMRIAQQHNFPITHLGAAPAVYGTQLISRSDSDWVIVPITEDPLFVETNRRFPMPKAILAQLHNYKKKGLQFEGIYVGHEIEPGVLKPGQSVTLDLIKPPPAPVVHQRLSSLSSKAQNAWQVLGGIGTDAARIAGWAAMIGLAAPIAVGVGAGVAVGASLPFIAAAITYDPILFGLHIDRSVIVYGRPLAAWYYLTHWDW